MAVPRNADIDFRDDVMLVARGTLDLNVPCVFERFTEERKHDGC
jgi:hypothetical protein